jgi:hypothetical protein
MRVRDLVEMLNDQFRLRCDRVHKYLILRLIVAYCTIIQRISILIIEHGMYEEAVH